MITAILAALIIVLGLYVSSHKLSGLQLSLAGLVLLGGFVLVISPDLASYAAKALNVGRGSDLIVYLLLVFGLFVCANYYFRFKKAEEQLVEVVRAVALIEASTGYDKSV